MAIGKQAQPLWHRWGVVVTVVGVLLTVPPAVVAVRELLGDSRKAESLGQPIIITIGQLAGVGLTQGLVSDPDGNLYVAANTAILRLNGEGDVSVVAGRPPDSLGLGGDGARLRGVRDLALSPSGALYFSDETERVWRVEADGSLYHVAGTGIDGDLIEGVAATQSPLDDPRGLAFDSDGNLYIADMLHDRIRRVDRAGIITSVGTVHSPNDLVSDSNGVVYLDDYEGRIYSITSGRLVQRFEPPPLDRRAEQPVRGLRPTFFAVAPDNTLLISDEFGGRIWKVDGLGWKPIAGTGAEASGGDGGPALEAGLASPWGIAVTPDWRVYVSTRTGIRSFSLR